MIKRKCKYSNFAYKTVGGRENPSRKLMNIHSSGYSLSKSVVFRIKFVVSLTTL